MCVSCNWSNPTWLLQQLLTREHLYNTCMVIHLYINSIACKQGRGSSFMLATNIKYNVFTDVRDAMCQMVMIWPSQISTTASKSVHLH